MEVVIDTPFRFVESIALRTDGFIEERLCWRGDSRPAGQRSRWSGLRFRVVKGDGKLCRADQVVRADAVPQAIAAVG